MALVLERVEALLGDTQEVRLVDLQMVRLDDMDHAEAALLGIPGFANHNPGNITEAMVALALES